MLNLIKSEVYKLKRQKLIIVLFVCVIGISAFSAYSQIHFMMVPDSPIQGRESFANAFQDIFMLFIMAVFAGFYIGSDFSNRTIQTALAGGHRRLDIIISKAVVFSLGACLLMLLYPATVCLIHTVIFGWGGPFDSASLLYLLRVAILGGILNIGTAGIYVCIGFLCRDIPKTICACFAFPILFSMISSTLGTRIPVIGRLIDYSTLSRLKYIVGDTLTMPMAMTAVLSAAATIMVTMALSHFFFSGAEIK